MLAVVVRREQDGQTQYEKHKFGTTRNEIASLTAWLQHQQVSEVVMRHARKRGVYGAILEASLVWVGSAF
jgi:hypothetical protein